MKNKIIAEARSWLGTPFHLHGRKKQIGCDCIGLVIGVASELSLKTHESKDIRLFDKINYSMSFQGSELCETLSKIFQIESQLVPGHLVAMEFDCNPNHLGILAQLEDKSFSIIHASITARKVIEQRLDLQLRSKIKQIYSMVN